MSELGDRLRALMEEKGVTAEELGRAGGIAADTVRQILAGDIERPPDRRLRGFARVLDVSFDNLLRLIPEDKREQSREEAAGFDGAAGAVVLAAAAPDWIQLMPAGDIRTRDGDDRGPWRLGDAQAVIERSRGAADSLAVDYDHQTDFTRKSGNAAPAAGWIAELQARDDGIWGRVEWTPKAKAAIEAREYRFISPVFTFDKKTRAVTRILRAGLTNDPALNLKALANREGGSEEEQMDDLLKKLRQILALADDADEAAICSAVKDAAATAKAAGDEKPLAGVAKALGLAETASAEEVETAAATATAGAAKAGDRDEIAGRLAKLEDDRASEKAEAGVDEAIKAGKLTPAQRDWAIGYAKGKPDEFATFIGSQPVIVEPGAQILGGKRPKGADGLTADELAVCQTMGLDPEDFKKTRDSERQAEGV